MAQSGGYLSGCKRGLAHERGNQLCRCFEGQHGSVESGRIDSVNTGCPSSCHPPLGMIDMRSESNEVQ